MRTLIALLLLAPLATQAQVFKCKDASGKTQYQDRPCSGAQKSAAFNSSAGNITGTAPQSEYQTRPDFDPNTAIAEDESFEENAREQDAQASDASSAKRMVPAEKCYTGVWKNRTWGCPFKREETAEEARSRLARANASASQGTQVIFDQYGRPYTDFGNGAPLIDQRTGKPCLRTGGPNIRCD